MIDTMPTPYNTSRTDRRLYSLSGDLDRMNLLNEHGYGTIWGRLRRHEY